MTRLIYQTVYSNLEFHNKHTPNSPALLAPNRQELTYRDLFELVQLSNEKLNSFGIQQNDPIAIVLPNGPEMAALFLTIVSCASAAPLNPTYQKAEFEFYLTDLKAKALVIQKGVDSPARLVAQELSIPIIELEPDLAKGAGWFNLSAKLSGPLSNSISNPQDIALILHTSGTTSRPKIVPLTVQNLLASAQNISTTLHLMPSDRCLNIMPLFHIHGLMAALLATIFSGGSIVCSPGFYVTEFFDWLKEFKPTWYTAVPTMHQSILSRVEANTAIVSQTQLRFVRSSSSSLAPTIMQQLQENFHCPVVEAYGMTEASHQMASNPITKGKQKPGSVGVAAGPEVSVMAEDSSLLLPVGKIGEIVIRGVNVTNGYLNNPDANAKAFVDGWFRTGDQGYQDEDGYFYLTGRLKEIINRGGEKISPREVDEVLLTHPFIAQALTFSMPDARLGEEVGAAVVLKEGNFLSESQIRVFVAEKLADFKVPRRIIILDEIPKGPTGKLQRIGLAEKLGLTGQQQTKQVPKRDYQAPQNLVEKTLVEIWQQVLKVTQIGIDDPFLELGGDSLLAAALVVEVTKKIGVTITVNDFVETPTIRLQAVVIAEKLAGGISKNVQAEVKCRVTGLNTGGSQPPVFFLSASTKDVFLLARLAKGLGFDHPLYGITPANYDMENFPDLLNYLVNIYLHEIKRLHPVGPYVLVGNCSGGILAYQIAQRLSTEGLQVNLLMMVETYGLNYPELTSNIAKFFAPILNRIYLWQKHVDVILASEGLGRRVYLKQLWKRQIDRLLILVLGDSAQKEKDSYAYHFRPGKNCNLRAYTSSSVVLFKAKHQLYGIKKDDRMGWATLIPENKLHIEHIDGYHGGSFPGNRAIKIGEFIRIRLKEI